MTRFPSLYALLTGEPEKASEARQRALLEYRKAKERGDTRAMHEARGRLVRATSLELVR